MLGGIWGRSPIFYCFHKISVVLLVLLLDVLMTLFILNVPHQSLCWLLGVLLIGGACLRWFCWASLLAELIAKHQLCTTPNNHPGFDEYILLQITDNKDTSSGNWGEIISLKLLYTSISAFGSSWASPTSKPVITPYNTWWYTAAIWWCSVGGDSVHCILPHNGGILPPCGTGVWRIVGIAYFYYIVVVYFHHMMVQCWWW